MANHTNQPGPSEQDEVPEQHDQQRQRDVFIHSSGEHAAMRFDQSFGVDGRPSLLKQAPVFSGHQGISTSSYRKGPFGVRGGQWGGIVASIYVEDLNYPCARLSLDQPSMFGLVDPHLPASESPNKVSDKARYLVVGLFPDSTPAPT